MGKVQPKDVEFLGKWVGQQLKNALFEEYKILRSHGYTACIASSMAQTNIRYHYKQYFQET